MMSPSRTLTARSDVAPRVVAVAAALGLSLALAVAAQLRIPLPFTPVPITLQTLVIYVAAVWLGPRAALSGIGLYLCAALAGVPVMSGFRGGAAAFAGATGGYIIGWFLAAYALGKLVDGRSSSLPRIVGAMLVASAVILSCGALHLGLWMQLTWFEALLLGVAPFVLGDLLKIAVATTLVRRWPNPIGLR